MPVIGAAHLITSATDNQTRLASRLATRDFEVLFDESPELPVAERPFLRLPAERHRLTFLRSKQGVALELISHRERPTGIVAPYQVLWSTSGTLFPDEAPLPDDRVSGAVASALGIPVRRVRSAEANLTYLLPGTDLGASSTHVYLVGLPCPDVATAGHFWEAGLGFQRVKEGTSPAPWRLVAFQGGFPNWRLRVLLVEDAPQAPTFIDDEGFSCVTLYVSNLEECLASLAGLGATEVSAPNPLFVNQKQVRLAFLRGPSGEVIELLEV